MALQTSPASPSADVSVFPWILVCGSADHENYTSHLQDCSPTSSAKHADATHCLVPALPGRGYSATGASLGAYAKLLHINSKGNWRWVAGAFVGVRGSGAISVPLGSRGQRITA